MLYLNITFLRAGNSARKGAAGIELGEANAF